MNLLSFLAVSAVVIVAPGPDMALVGRNALFGGRRVAVSTAAGVVLGLTVWSLAASVGVAALLRRSEPAFVTLKIVGAVYLLPEFGPVDASVAALLSRGIVFCLMALVWLVGYGAFVAKAGDVLRRPRIRRGMEGLSGAVLIAFGVRLATADN